jgi:catechol 2,3-dioxygenase-like lactoylglutathione lyase family enzyme
MRSPSSSVGGAEDSPDDHDAKKEPVTMPVTRLNHAVLYVRDVERSVAFYADALGFRTVSAMPGAAFLQASGSTNDHDLGLFEIGSEAAASTAGRGTVGLYHLAWEVDTLDELERIARTLSDLGALHGASDHSTTKALYAKDPDGIEFEVSWLVPAELIDEATLAGRTRIAPLDLQREKERYGGQTRGGVGVSIPTIA